MFFCFVVVVVDGKKLDLMEMVFVCVVIFEKKVFAV